MTWPRAYRLTLRLLPAELRRKHGAAMEVLFAREFERARERGAIAGAGAGVAAVWDAVARAAYERLRSDRRIVGTDRRRRAGTEWGANVVAPTHHLTEATLGSPSMTSSTARPRVRHLAVSFLVAFAVLTACLLTLFATKQLPPLAARGASAATLGWTLLLAVPFTAAMTIPMAAFVAVVWVFTRLGAAGALRPLRRDVPALRGLLAPVLGLALVVGALELVWTDQLVPRANAQLSTVMTGSDGGRSDRAMTIAELRAAARSARADDGQRALVRAATYEVEVQKKYALAAACVLLALAGAAIALRFPRGGARLVVGASVAVFWAYYLCIIAGESLADRLMVSPVVGVWAANMLLLVAAAVALWATHTTFAQGREGAPVVGG